MPPTDVRYSSIEVPFRKGDWLLLYTDGISEMTSESEEPFGDDRLEAFFSEHAAPPAASFAEHLLEHLAVWRNQASGREPDDDVTLMAIHFQAPGGVSGTDRS